MLSFDSPLKLQNKLTILNPLVNVHHLWRLGDFSKKFIIFLGPPSNKNENDFEAPNFLIHSLPAPIFTFKLFNVPVFHICNFYH